MTGTSGKAKNKAMLQAAKALAAAATSLASVTASLTSAADALTLLCEEDDDECATVKSGGPASIGDQSSTVAPTPGGTSVVDYDDSSESDDEYMALAREEVRVAATATMPRPDHATPGMILDYLYWRWLNCLYRFNNRTKSWRTGKDRLFSFTSQHPSTPCEQANIL
jgi:hypothetical protein